MDTTMHMILKNRKDITTDVTFCKYNPRTKKYDVTFKNGSTYSCNYSTIEWLKNPQVLNPALVRMSYEENELYDVQAIYVFQSACTSYWRVRFLNGCEKYYNENNLKIVTSCLSDESANNCLEYLKQIAAVNELKTNDGATLLAEQYKRLEFIGDDTALAVYLNPNKYKVETYQKVNSIFPFGCNASQFKAVQTALSSKISVIQGPPGTGKTQTILNIIANLLLQGKTIQVVSNNNSATANVLEKLSSEKYGMGFIVASLGSSANKKNFIENQVGKYPDLAKWKIQEQTEAQLPSKLSEVSSALLEIFKKQERLANANQELNALELEIKYFEQYCKETDFEKNAVKIRKALKSDQVMQLWQECFDFSNRECPISFWYKLKSVFFYGISDWNFFRNDISKVITLFQSLFYQTKHSELSDEITNLKRELETVDASEKQDELTQLSMKYLKGILYKKYRYKEKRVEFTEESFWKTPKDVINEYPIILSTTFSSKSSLGKDMIYDYLIMDEASQVDIATGALSLSCAKNVVIVGDRKQLPNVVTEDTKNRTDAIWRSFNIESGYSFSTNSFLESVCNIIPNVPQTLLREHYRCHPKIIGFCNQKFYNNELIIMTEDKGEANVLSLFKTVKGNHKRDNFNQRQIDTIKEDVLPKLQGVPSKDIGIIAPYNDQVDEVKKQIAELYIDVATVHKFQGREKDTIIISTVDDVVTKFSDDPNLLNVSVSRAKKKLIIIASGNDQPVGSNIADLISYIEYNNFEVSEGKIYSVFDYLYKQYTQERLAFLKKRRRISEFDSENLMYAMVKKILSKDIFISLDVICHQPLNMLIRDPKFLSDEECRYAMNPGTHLDFLIYSGIGKKPVLALEVDGFYYHKDGTVQAARDKMKNHILELYNIPLLRFPTNGSGEYEKLIKKLEEVYQCDEIKIN